VILISVSDHNNEPDEIEAAKKKLIKIKPDFKNKLFWKSWQEFYQILESIKNNPVNNDENTKTNLIDLLFYMKVMGIGDRDGFTSSIDWVSFFETYHNVSDILDSLREYVKNYDGLSVRSNENYSHLIGF
jgi:hypothetical protein|tara:strand:+ start:501 stop:890 length:390 start_codon:yes stop_codon:yes gene_type:complete